MPKLNCSPTFAAIPTLGQNCTRCNFYRVNWRICSEIFVTLCTLIKSDNYKIVLGFVITSNIIQH